MTKDKLEQYYSIDSRIQAIQTEIRDLYTPNLGGKGNSIGAGRASVLVASNPTEETALRIDMLKSKLQKECQELLELREEIEEWLSSVVDPEIEAIVRWHYLLRLNWKQTNLKVYGYANYDYSRKRIERYFARN